MKIILPGSLLLLGLTACLEPLSDDEIDPRRAFGDPSIPEPGMALHVEDDPELAAQVRQFSTQVAYLRGYAQDGPLWYWNVDGPNATFIAPIYYVYGLDDQPKGRPIIDQIPGRPGYTPWWRKYKVKVTTKYTNERIWSRDAVEAGIRLGILEQPEETTEVYDFPVVLRDTKIPVDRDQLVDADWGWYRNRRVHWAQFKEPYTVPLGQREMPSFIVYVLQRVNQPAPIYEFLTGVDVTGDGRLDNSNNIFEDVLNGPRYSPLWYVALVRVQPDYPSIDNTRSATVGLDAATDFRDAAGQVVSPWVVREMIQEVPTFLVNCPIQRMKGAL